MFITEKTIKELRDEINELEKEWERLDHTGLSQKQNEITGKLSELRAALEFVKTYIKWRNNQ